MQQLELHKLIDVLDATNDVSAYYDVRRKYNLNGKITINENGKLNTTINLAAMQGLFDVDLKLSEENFIKSYECGKRDKHLMTDGMSKPDLFSFALTSKNEFKYTMNGKKVKK